jgi:hypothetical protein
MTCRNHPQREAAVRCEKLQIGYCQACLDDCMACTDPCGYCKFRGQCVIWELCRRSPRRYELEAQAKGREGQGA